MQQEPPVCVVPCSEVQQDPFFFFFFFLSTLVISLVAPVDAAYAVVAIEPVNTKSAAANITFFIALLFFVKIILFNSILQVLSIYL